MYIFTSPHGVSTPKDLQTNSLVFQPSRHLNKISFLVQIIIIITLLLHFIVYFIIYLCKCVLCLGKSLRSLHSIKLFSFFSCDFLLIYCRYLFIHLSNFGRLWTCAILSHLLSSLILPYTDNLSFCRFAVPHPISLSDLLFFHSGSNNVKPIRSIPLL